MFVENYAEILDFRIAIFLRILTGILWIESEGKADSARGRPFTCVVLSLQCTSSKDLSLNCYCIHTCLLLLAVFTMGGHAYALVKNFDLKVYLKKIGLKRIF